MLNVYIKDYAGWNIRKQQINKRESNVFFCSGEIWWCSIGINIDVEMDGKNEQFERPVLILKKINQQSAIIAPLTSTFKDNHYYYKICSLESSVVISQIRCISRKRLLRKISKINNMDFKKITAQIKNMFGS